MASHPRDDCSTENGLTFVSWVRRSLKADSAQRGGLNDVRISGYVASPRGGGMQTLYPVRFSYMHKPGNPPQEYSWAYNVTQDHDDKEDPFVDRAHVPEQLAYLQGQLNKGKVEARLEGNGLETVLIVSKK